MIILHQKYGQLANRMIIISHFIALSLEHNKKIKIYNFDEYINFFNFSNLKNSKISIKKSNYLTKILISIFYRFDFISPFSKVISLNKINHPIDKEYNINNLLNTNKKIIIPEGWNFRNHNNVIKHSHTIREIFKPNQLLNIKIKNLINQFNTNLIVGVHIRRGDYINWMEGKYYYDNTIYNRFINHINQLLFPKKCTILIFSNEKISDNDFTFSNLNICNGNAVEDLFTLSNCDYIIGPPSTYSLVAAFLGKKKLFHIESSDYLPEIDEFKIIDTL